jgi:hypothetical protein
LRVKHGMSHFDEMTGFDLQTAFSATKWTDWYG